MIAMNWIALSPMFDFPILDLPISDSLAIAVIGHRHECNYG
jgi:hypothetical protein